MKKNTHPTYQQVLFVDSASGYRFLCGSALQPEARETFEGAEYPVSYLSISSSSHPFFTGSKQLVDSEGRVEKFKKRFGASKASAHNNLANDEKGSEPKAETKAAAPAKPAAAPAKPAAKPAQKQAAKPAAKSAAKPEAKKKK